jgi:hypothetical protein
LAIFVTQEDIMYHSSNAASEVRPATRQKWQEPKVLVERLLSANAQAPDPNAAPLFGPFSTITS